MQFGGAASDVAGSAAVLIADDGGLLVGGSTTGSFAGAPNAGAQDSWVRKADRRGNELWSVQFGGAGTSTARQILANPLDNGFYVISNVDDGEVHRFDKDGIEIWSVAVDLGGATSINPGYWGAVDSKGDILLVSWLDTASGLARAFVITRFSGADGSQVWQRSYFPSVDGPIESFHCEYQPTSGKSNRS